MLKLISLACRGHDDTNILNLNLWGTHLLNLVFMMIHGCVFMGIARVFGRICSL